ncbi:MAG: PQQ-dependent sugar dehydrogenase [Croceibacterium sp.]
MKRISAAMKSAMALALCGISGVALAQQAAPAPAAAPAAAPAPARQAPPPVPPLGEGPWDIQTADAKLHVEVLVRGLDHPWGMAFLPDGSMLVTERPGRLRVIRNGVLDPTPIAGLPQIFAPGIAGLTDVVLDPDFARNRLIYISYSKPDPKAGPNPPPAINSTLAVMRAKWDGSKLTEVKDIFVADSWYGAVTPTRCCGQGPTFGSYGGRMAFLRDGSLLVTSGDRNYGEMVQKPDNHFGKIMRLTTEGKPAAGNPFAGRAGWKADIWTIGHRNPTGLTVDPATGTVWETEFGPRGGDEVNRITKGGNYGWIDVTQGYHYNGEAPAKGRRGVAGFIDPVFTFGPPSGNPGNVAVYRGTAFPDWNGDLLIAAMNRSLVRLKLDKDGHVTGHEPMLQQLGQRLRDVRVGPDGALYILTDETGGGLLKVTPAK